MDNPFTSIHQPLVNQVCLITLRAPLDWKIKSKNLSSFVLMLIQRLLSLDIPYPERAYSTCHIPSPSTNREQNAGCREKWSEGQGKATGPGLWRMPKTQGIVETNDILQPGSHANR
jgi:hypothetical protein